MLVIWKLRDRPSRLISNGFLPSMRWPLQQHLAAGGREAAADQVEQRRLARAVGADDGDALAGLHLQVGSRG
jgi:hypothetical protein